MTYEALWISDIHIEKGLPHAKPSSHGRTDRLDDQLAMLRRVRQTALENGIKDVWIPGDLNDTSRPDAVTLKATCEALVDLADAGLTVYLIPGNHDAISVSGEHFLMEAFGAMKRKGLVYLGGRHAEPMAFGNVRIWPLEYKPAKQALESIVEIQSAMDRDNVNVLAMHQSVLGCTHIGWTCDDGLDPDVICEGFDAVVSGHFHDTQRFGPGGVGMFLGAPMHHHYGDVGRPAGFWRIKMKDDGKIVRKFVDGGAPTFHEHDWNGEHVHASLRPGSYLRYRVRATHAEWAILRAQADVAVALAQSSGIRASHSHIPVYHHDRRLGAEGVSSAEALKPDELVAAYVSAKSVDTTGLDPKKLRRIGKQVLERARLTGG